MKYLFRAFFAVWFVSIFFITPKAEAAIFTDTLSFVPAGGSFTTVSYPAGVSSGFFWEHDFRDFFKIQELGPVRISDAVLTLVYSQTNLSEKWILEGLGSLLSTSPILSTAFPLGEEFLTRLETGGKLRVNLLEETTGADSVRLFSSQLAGNYERQLRLAAAVAVPVSPEPGTTVLLASGILGAFLTRFRKLRAA